MNRNELAVRVSQLEGKKVQINIAQIKEVLKCTLQIMATEMTDLQVTTMLERVRSQVYVKARKKRP